MDAIAKQVRQVIDWSWVDELGPSTGDGTQPCPGSGNQRPFKSSRINDREVYMKGVDASYHYEGYDVQALRSERPRQKPGRDAR